MIPSAVETIHYVDEGEGLEFENFASILLAGALVFGLLTGVVLNWLSRTRVPING